MGYTALVYVHGIGEQQRFFELSRLVERLERYAGWYETGAGGHGAISSVAVQLEPDRIGNAGSRTFVRIHRGTTEVRAYEAYWAPFTAGGRSAPQVARWIVRQWWAPVRGLKDLLWDKRWDLHRRHRTAMLYECVSRRRNRRGRFPVRLVSRLLEAYDGFVDATARGTVDGSPQAFVERLRGERNLRRVAEAWVRYAVRRELGILGILTTIVLAGALLLLALAAAVLAAVGLLEPFVARLPEPARALLPLVGYEPGAFGWWHALQAVVLAFLAWGGGSFLSRYLGDVKVWATYQETERDYRVRQQILDDVRDLLLHVLADGECDRIVVVGHSLGTSIAFEALLALRRHEQTQGRSFGLDRIDHFVTLGSPVDKIQYFFTYDVRTAHRFERVLEEFRGDLDDPPFSVPGTAGCRCGTTRPHLHWINIFDPADVVSGSLQSPASSRCAEHRVDNLQLCLLHFPAPGASHLAYFDDRRVLQILYGAIFDAEYAFARAPKRLRSGSDTEAMFLWREGERCLRTRIVHGTALVLPWLAAAAWLLAAAGLAPDTVRDGILTLTAVLVFAALAIGLWPAALRHPLRPPAAAVGPHVPERRTTARAGEGRPAGRAAAPRPGQDEDRNRLRRASLF